MSQSSIQKCCAPHSLKKEAHGPNLPLPIKRYFTSSFWKDNYLLSGYLLVFLVVNILTFIVGGVQLKDFKNGNGSSPNIYYIVARATGIPAIH